MTDQPALFEDVRPAFGDSLRPFHTSYHVGQLTPAERQAALQWARANEARRKADPTDGYAFDATDERRELERLIASIEQPDAPLPSQW